MAPDSGTLGGVEVEVTAAWLEVAEEVELA